MRRTLLLALDVRVSDQLAQQLALGRWILVEQLRQGVVTFFQQTFAPRFDALQFGGFAAALLAILLQRGTDRLDHLVVVIAHGLGKELQLAFARDVRSDAA